MVTTAELVARVVHEDSPFVRCFACLALHLVLAENEVRETAQIMIIRDHFHIARRGCHVCFRPAHVLVRGKQA
jgi:hypothetical protein